MDISIEHETSARKREGHLLYCKFQLSVIVVPNDGLLSMLLRHAGFLVSLRNF